MNKQTLKALKGSIKKWELIVAGEGKDLGAENCPLCQLFIVRGCKGCPVMEKTGYAECKGSPYDEWIKGTKFKNGRRADTPEKKKLARAELKFLKSLLP